MSPSPPNLHVFVYGTLKRGQPNHHWMTEEGKGQCHCLGIGETAVKYPLVINSGMPYNVPYTIPYLLNVPDTGHHIQGEVYKVDQQRLKHLDILEDYPKHYTRREEKIKLLPSKSGSNDSGHGSEITCLVYFLSKHQPDMLELQMFDNYLSEGDHGKPFQLKDNADPAPYFHVFVYGTLKREQPNHYWMTEDGKGECHYVGRGKTAVEYPLVIASRYNIPYLLNVPGTGHHIQGEVYKVDEQRLKHLDILEDYPKHYTRTEEKIKLVPSTSGNNVGENSGQHSEISCLIYFLSKHKSKMLELQMFDNYQSEGAHGKPYQPCDDLCDPNDIDL